MALSYWVHLSIGLSLGVIGGILTAAILLSLWKRPKIGQTP